MNLFDNSSSNREKLRKCFHIVLIITCILMTVLSWLWLTYHFFSLFLPQFLATICFYYLHYRIFVQILKMIVFPGSSRLYRKQSENQLASGICKRQQNALKNINELVIKIQQNSSAEYIFDENYYSLSHCLEIIEHLVKVYTRIEINGELNTNQTYILQRYIILINQINQLAVIRDDQKTEIMFYQLIMGNHNYYNKLNTHKVYFNNQIVANHVYTSIQELIDFYERLKCQGELQKLRNQSIANLIYMRTELQMKYNCKQMFIDGIDCMFFMSNDRNSQNESFDQIDSNLMIFCLPNAGYYENLYYDSDWIDIYQRLGITFMVWNYGGYGRSKGSPSVKNIINDGLKIISYIRKYTKYDKIGVHGESMGGMVATVLAQKCNLHFLCTDRSFSRLSEVIHNKPKLQFILKMMMDWDKDIVQSFNKVKCTKVVCYDPKDEIIGYFGSLKEGLVRDYFRKRQKIKKIKRRKIVNIHFQNNKIQMIYNFFYRRYVQVSNKYKELKEFCNQKNELLFIDSVIEYEKFKQLLFGMRRVSRMILMFCDSDFARKQDNSQDSNDSNQTLQEQGENYEDLVTDEHMGNQEILDIIKEMIEGFEETDSAGVNLKQIFIDDCYDNQEYMLKSWMMNLFVWGSQKPIEIVIQQKMSTQQAIQYGQCKLQFLRDKIHQIIEDKRNSSDKLMQKIVSDLMAINDVVELLRFKIEQEMIIQKQQEQTEQSFMTVSNIHQQMIDEQPGLMIDSDHTTNGILVVLSSGHNGNLDNQQLQLLVQHLRMSEMF